MSSIPKSGSLIKYKSLSELMASTPIYDPSPPGGSSRPIELPDTDHTSAGGSTSPIVLSSDESSWKSTDPESSTSGSLESSQDYYPSKEEENLSDDDHPLSWGSVTDKSSPNSPGSSQGPHLPTPGPTNNSPPQGSPSDPGQSKEPNPSTSVKRPRPEDLESEIPLGKILKGKFKRRFSGLGASKVAERDLQGTFSSRAHSTSLQPPSVSYQQTTVVANWAF